MKTTNVIPHRQRRIRHLIVNLLMPFVELSQYPGVDLAVTHIRALSGTFEKFLLRSLEDITDHEMLIQAGGVGNSPLWIMGHLCVATDLGLLICRSSARSPRVWRKQFGMGSDPAELAGDLPTKSDLVQVFTEARGQLVEEFESLDSAVAENPHEIALFENSSIKTVGDFVAHLLTTHISFHAGQLSAWRRQQGRPAMF